LEPVTKQEGEEMAAKISAYKYIECSALTQDNLQEVFHETIRSVISPGTKDQSSAGKTGTDAGKVKPNSKKDDKKNKSKDKDKEKDKDKGSKKKGGLFKK